MSKNKARPRNKAFLRVALFSRKFILKIRELRTRVVSVFVYRGSTLNVDNSISSYKLFPRGVYSRDSLNCTIACACPEQLRRRFSRKRSWLQKNFIPPFRSIFTRRIVHRFDRSIYREPFPVISRDTFR